MERMYEIEKMIPENTKNVIIMGHISPDGDCIGSTLGMYHYLCDNVPGLNITVALQKFENKYSILEGVDQIQVLEEVDPDSHFDLCITCDAADLGRLGAGQILFEHSDYKICIDHHITNKGFADENYVFGGLSSCAEAVCYFLNPEKISKSCAMALYTGIAHDTGLFRFPATTSKTMMWAGKLMELGADAQKIIDKTYFGKDLGTARLHAKAIDKMCIAFDGRLAYTVVLAEEMRNCGVNSIATHGLIDQLRVIEGVKVAVVFYQRDDGVNKVSLRSNTDFDVAAFSSRYGGGGHVKAAGFSSTMPLDELVSSIVEEITGLL